MQPRFAACQKAMDQDRFSVCLRELPALVREAESPAELLLASEVAALALRYYVSLRLLRRAARSPECPPAVHLELASFSIGMDRFLEAEEMLTPWLACSDWSAEERAEAHLHVAVSLAARRRPQSAQRAIDQAVELVPAPEGELARKVSYARAILTYSADRWEEAAAYLAGQIERGMTASRFYLLLARCHEHLGRPDEALTVLQAGCAKLPEHPVLWMAVARTAWALQLPGVALEASARVDDLLPDRRTRRRTQRQREFNTRPAVRLPVPPLHQGHNHCFPACLTMVMGRWGRQIDHRTVGQAVMDDSRGTPLYRALRYLEEQGWAVRTFRATPERLQRLVDQGVPAILGLEYSGGSHVHVCAGYDRDSFLLQDPASIGTWRVRLADFDKAYAHSDYWALAFTPPEAAGALEELPVDDDRQIRRLQACWEALDRRDLQAARSIYDQVMDQPTTPGLQLFRLRTWPRLGARGEALAAVESLLAAFPANRELRLEVAEHLERLEERERAAAVAREEPGRLSATALSLLGRTAPEIEQSITLLRQAAIAAPQQPRYVAEWGRACLSADRLEQAEALFAAALEMEPSPPYQADMADLRTHQERPAEAVAGFRHLLREARHYPWAWWRRGEAHWQLGQHRAAARCLRIALSQEPDRTVFTGRLSDLYDAMGQRQRAITLLQESPLLAGSADLQSALCSIFLAEGQWDEALALARPALAAFADDARFPPMAAEALRRTGRSAEGRELLAAAAEQWPTGNYVQARYGRYLLLEGDTEAGLARIRRALELDPDWTDPIDWVSTAAGELADRGRFDDAERIFRAALDLCREPAWQANTGDLATHAWYGLYTCARRRSDRTAGAEVYLREAVSAAQDQGRRTGYADELTDLLVDRQEFTAAEAFLEGLQGRVAEPWRLTYLGYVAELLEHSEAAVARYDQALSVDAEYQWAHFRRPLGLLKLKRAQEALDHALSAVARWPEDGGMHWALGRCYHAMEDTQRAAEQYVKALELDPEWGASSQELWRLHSERGWETMRELVSQLPPATRASVYVTWGDLWREEGGTVGGIRATAAWDAATEADPDCTDAYIRLAEQAKNDEKPVLAWERTLPILVRRPAAAYDFAHWLWERTPPEASAPVLTRAADQLPDTDSEWRGQLRALAGEAWRAVGKDDQAHSTWEQAIADIPSHGGILCRLSQRDLLWKRYDPILARLTPLDDQGALPTDVPIVVAAYLEAAIARQRPRRPYWRQLILQRLEHIRQQGGAEPGEIEKLCELFERLEVEFGHLHSAWLARTTGDDLVSWARVGLMRLRYRRSPPPLAVRPGEPVAPAADRPLDPAEPWPPRLWPWLKRNPVAAIVAALTLVIILTRLETTTEQVAFVMMVPVTVLAAWMVRVWWFFR